MPGPNTSINVQVFRGSPGGPIQTQALVNGSTPLSTIEVVDSDQAYDLEIDNVAVVHQIIFDVPKSLLGLTSPINVPVDVISGGGADISSLVLDMDRASDVATMTLFDPTAAPGESVPYVISGLLPGSAFNFFIDEALLFSGLLDGTGSSAGSFIMPTLPDDSQPRPGAVDRAHLVVHEARGEADLHDGRLIEVRLDPRRLLRPADPEPAGGIERARERHEPSRELAPASDEEDDHVERPADAPREFDAAR